MTLKKDENPNEFNKCEGKSFLNTQPQTQMGDEKRFQLSIVSSVNKKYSLQ